MITAVAAPTAKAGALRSESVRVAVALTARYGAVMDDDKDKATEKPGTEPSLPPGGKPTEVGGRKGPDPSRFGDWEKDGRCVDF